MLLYTRLSACRSQALERSSAAAARAMAAEAEAQALRIQLDHLHSQLTDEVRCAAVDTSKLEAPQVAGIPAAGAAAAKPCRHRMQGWHFMRFMQMLIPEYQSLSLRHGIRCQ